MQVRGQQIAGPSAQLERVLVCRQVISMFKDDTKANIRRCIEVFTTKAQTPELHADLLNTRTETGRKNNGLVRRLELRVRPMRGRCGPS